MALTRHSQVSSAVSALLGQTMPKMPVVHLTIFALALVTQNTPAFGSDVTCGGINTTIYSSRDTTLNICHGPYTKVDRSKLHQWQNCDDAMIQITDKKSGKTSLYVDCGFPSKKQYMLRNNEFMVRHFYSGFPNFDEKPLLVETLNLATKKKKYEFLKIFPVCRKQEIEQAIQQIDSTRSKPFDGNTFFASIYGGFYKLRDCAATDSVRVLAALQKYQTGQTFDGEVAETLGIVIHEVELIALASSQLK